MQTQKRKVCGFVYLSVNFGKVIGKAHNKAYLHKFRRLETHTEGKFEPGLIVDGFVNLNAYEEGEYNKENGNGNIKFPELCHKMIIYV